MTLHPFEQTVNGIPYQSKHAPLLFGLVRWLQPESVVEVGTHIGCMACWLARAVQLNGHGRVTCIDPFCWTQENQEEQWEANLLACGVRDFVTLIPGRSQEVEWPASVDFCFVDGNHTYDVCQHDVEKAASLGASCIAIHDTVSWEGSRNYAEQIRGEIEATHDQEYHRLPGDWWIDWDIFESEFDCGMTILKKRFPKGPCEGLDAGEKWDVPTPAPVKNKGGRPRKT